MTPRVAILPWGDAIEDFLEPLGLSLDAFREEVDGGWLFGYVDALRAAGVHTTVVCCSVDARAPARWRHRPTGACLLVLPLPRPARRLRRMLRDPYAWSATLREQPAHQLAPYLATPLRALGAAARAEGWQALLCQEYEYQRFDACVALGAMLGLPVFGTFQGGDQTRTALERRVRPLTMRHAAGFVIASGAEAERVRRTYRIPPERIAAIANPLDAERWRSGDRERTRAELGIPPGAMVVAWHGRVELRRKGLDVLLEAWAALDARTELPERRLLLIGSGPDDAALRGVRGVVRVERYVVDRARLAALLGAADVYAFPSRHEGFAVAPLEALACGLPVVAAGAPGVAELLPAGEASGGIVVASGDPQAFAAALIGLISDPDARARLAVAARRRATAFAPEAVGRELRRVLLAGG